MKLMNGIWRGFLSLFLVVIVSITTVSVTVQKPVEAQPIKDVTIQPQEKVGSKNVQLTFQGYLQGSTTHLRAEAIGELIRKFVGYQVTVKTGAGLAAAIGFSQGKLDMHLTQGPYNITQELLQKETPGLAQKYKEALIVPVYEKYELLLVLDEVKGSSLSDLLAKKYPLKVGVGTVHSRVCAEKIFMTYGVSFKDIESWGGKVDLTTPMPQVCEHMKEGFLNAHMSFSGAGAAYIEDLGAVRKVKALPIAHADSELKAIQKVLPEFYRVILSPKTYRFVNQDVPTIACPEYLAARPDVAEDVIYNITKAIWENASYLVSISRTFAAVLQQQRAMELLKMRRDDIHPGSMRYYKEKRWLI